MDGWETSFMLGPAYFQGLCLLVSGSGYLVPSSNLQSSLWQLRLYLDHWRVQLVLASHLVVMIHTPRKVLEWHKQQTSAGNTATWTNPGCNEQHDCLLWVLRKNLPNSQWWFEQLWRDDIISWKNPTDIYNYHFLPAALSFSWCENRFPEKHQFLGDSPTTINGSPNNFSFLTSPLKDYIKVIYHVITLVHWTSYS